LRHFADDIVSHISHCERSVATGQDVGWRRRRCTRAPSA
jgi:hypothetical protein